MHYTCPAGQCFSSVAPITDCAHVRRKGVLFRLEVPDDGAREREPLFSIGDAAAARARADAQAAARRAWWRRRDEDSFIPRGTPFVEHPVLGRVPARFILRDGTRPVEIQDPEFLTL